MPKRSAWEEPASLPQAIAYCSITQALRPYLRRGVPFVACLVVKPEHLKTYETVAENLLLRRQANGIRRANDGASVTAFGKGDQSLNIIHGNLQGFSRVVFIFARETDIPESVKAASDVFRVFGDPDADTMRSALAVFFGRRHDVDDDIILTADWSDLAIVFRKGRSPHQALGRLKTLMRQSPVSAVPTAKRPAVDPTEGLRALKGYGEASVWGIEMAHDLPAYKSGLIEWADVDRGLLLVGGPGTGKTSFGRILAEACDVPFFHGSYSIWQSAGHQGEMLRDMRRTFKEAIDNAPCILLIDELESFSRRDREGHHSDYMRGVVNGLLELLDGVESREGVVVIATTNDPAIVEPAVLRSGRIENQVKIGKPDAEARCHILERYLAWPIPDEARAEIAQKTEGLTGADLERLAKKARQTCRRETRELDIAVLMSCLPALITVPADRLRVAALHESGHAIVGLRHGRKINRVRLLDRYLEDASTFSIGTVEFEHDGFKRHTPEHLLQEISIMLGGLAAERDIVGGHDPGAGGGEQSDLVRATDLATTYEAVFAMGDTLVSERLGNWEDLARMRRQNVIVWNRIDALLKQQLQATRDIVVENRAVIEALAAHLVQARSMSGVEVLEFVQANGFQMGENGSAQLRSA